MGKSTSNLSEHSCACSHIGLPDVKSNQLTHGQPATVQSAISTPSGYIIMVTPEGRQVWMLVTGASPCQYFTLGCAEPSANSAESLQLRAAALKAAASEAKALALRARGAAAKARRRSFAMAASSSGDVSALQALISECDADESSCAEDDELEFDFD